MIHCSLFFMLLESIILVFIALSVVGCVNLGGVWLWNWYSGYEETYVENAGQDLYGMFSNISPRRILQASLLCFLVVTALVFFLIGNFNSLKSFLGSAFFSLALGVAGFFIPRWILKRMAAHRLQKFNLQLLDALMSMSNSLKAGFSIIQAFEAVVEEKRNPIAQELDLFLKEIRLGVKFETASDHLEKRVGSEDLQIMLMGIETARQTGGKLTEVFERLAEVIRERMRIQGRIQSLTAQGRLQAWSIGAMPFVLGFAIYFIQPKIMNAFFQSPAGILMILIMLMLEVIGLWLVRKIVKIDV